MNALSRQQAPVAELNLWEARALALQLLVCGTLFNDCQRRFLWQMACRFRRVTPYRQRVLTILTTQAGGGRP
ncbi:hypothetical protein [Teichococcus aestuarii]|uniref:hypothetical protein n=1 Tax=Teichococcus aestuarii TaxID=568898 RepID=UPI0011B256CA|nr:hypothetical protein [Pseudoroseomonas aestuarii]